MKALIWEQILIGIAPLIIIGAIASFWRFATRLDRNTAAIQDMDKSVTRLDKNTEGLTVRITALENWRDLISAQAVAKELKRDS